MNRLRPTEQNAIGYNILIAAIFILSLWVAKHPYLGIVHDARYYLLQTLHALEPTRWNEDLFFRYGSQDSFSIFSSVYKWPVGAIGIAAANLLAIVIGDGLWLASLGLLVCSILNRPTERLAAACGVIALNTGYGGLDTLHYAEPFITPRLFAEAAVMCGFAAASRGRYVLLSMLSLLAAAIHPLSALPGIGIITFDSLRRDRRTWSILGLISIVCIIAAWLRIEPFSRATQFYAPDWFQVASTTGKQILISNWHFSDYAKLANSLIILEIFLTVANEKERKIATSILVITSLGCAVSFLGADIIHNVLITNLQLWRVLWVTNLASNAAILLLLIRVDKARRMPLAIAVVFSLLPGLLLSLDMTAPFVVLLCLLWYLHRNFRNNRIRLLAASAILIPMAFVLALAVYSLYLQLTLDRYIVRHVLDLALLTAAAFGLIWYVRHPQNKLIIVVSVGILASSMLVADQRSSWNRYVYGSSQDITLNQFLANAGTTFWEGENGTELLWFKERKPSYFSCMQAAESVFFQAVAAEWSRRKSALQLLHTVGFSDESCTSIFSGTNSKVEVEAVCQSLPDLDTIVLNHPVPELPNRTWTAPTYQEVMESKKTGNAIKKKLVKISAFYRYDCATLRESP